MTNAKFIEKLKKEGTFKELCVRGMVPTHYLNWLDVYNTYQSYYKKYRNYTAAVIQTATDNKLSVSQVKRIIRFSKRSR